MLSMQVLSPVQTTPQSPQLKSLSSPLHEPLQQADRTSVGHCVPHVPQCILSDCRSAHVPEQHVSLEKQALPQKPQLLVFVWVLTHVPPQHVSSIAHAVPHAPQLFRLLVRSMHLPLQSVPVAHPHVPFEHVSSELQATLHEPQWVGSLVRSTHAPLQKVCPAAHAATQPPNEHIWVAVHA
jgi:hypothetical protein